MSNSATPAFSGAKNLLYTTAVLTGTTLFARTIVVYYNVYLSGKIGAVGIGVFELIMSVYAFAKTAVTAGVSLASTRMIAEETTGRLKDTMRRIECCCLALGITCGVLLFFLSPVICRNFLDDPPGGIFSLRLLSLALPFLSMGAAYGGYFVAREKMRHYAPVQIAEQIIRVAITVALLERFSRESLGYSVISISLAITLSEVVAWLFSLIFYRILTHREERKRDVLPRFGSFFKSFARLTLPVGGGALFRASLNTVYNIMVPAGLKKSGATAERSLSSYGIVQGMALPVLLYPGAVMGVVSLQLVPAVAAFRAAKAENHIAYVSRRVLHFTMLFSVAAAGIMFFFSGELSALIFHTSDAAGFLKALAPLVPIMYLDTVTDGILKGLDLQMKVLGIGIVDSLLSLTLIVFLLPPFAITGYLVTIYVGECVNTLLGQIELRRHVKIRFDPWHDILSPVLSVTLGCLLTRAVLFLPLARPDLPVVLCAIAASLTLCILMFCLTRALNSEELYWVRTLLPYSRRDKPGAPCGPVKTR